jgi:hypothetical protein
MKRMRIILGILVSFSILSAKAQTYLPLSVMNYAQWHPFPSYNLLGDSAHSHQKWQFNTYSAMSAGYLFSNGGGASYISAPVGLQLTRQLNNNLYAFAGVSAAPAFYNFNSSFTSPLSHSVYPGGYPSNAYQFGMNARVEMGLMYINDAKTFSISGSIGVEQSSFPSYPVPPNRTATKRQ